MTRLGFKTQSHSQVLNSGLDCGLLGLDLRLTFDLQNTCATHTERGGGAGNMTYASSCRGTNIMTQDELTLTM